MRNEQQRGDTEDSTFQTLEIWELFVTLALIDQSGWPFERRQAKTFLTPLFWAVKSLFEDPQLL